ncbi:MAG TPA: hypothetical protein DEH78_24545 [Solibacterales bacterium]|nr:hypothetical protein [Bryobacterales bacterium]
MQEKLRAWWWSRQGLDGSLAARAPAEVLARSGWARSVGGAGPYLTAFARAGTPREAMDEAAAAAAIHELPSARGCTYVLPEGDFALGLKAGQAFAGAEMKTARTLGVKDAEIERLSDALILALAKGPLEPERLREAVGGACRNLGPEGQKKGVATTLPVALGRLQSIGEIRRLSANGRLDQQRYKYALWRPNPLDRCRLSAEEVNTELARRYFRWIGPATLASFQGFAGLGVKAAKAAVEPLRLQPIGEASDHLLLPEDLEAWGTLRPSREHRYALLGNLDALVLLRRDLSDLVDPADRDRALFASGLSELQSHPIFDRGRLVGLWEFDTSNGSIVASLFVKPNQALTQAMRRTEEFIQSQLGDFRSFSLDSPKSRAPRIASLQKAAGAN